MESCASTPGLLRLGVYISGGTNSLATHEHTSVENNLNREHVDQSTGSLSDLINGCQTSPSTTVISKYFYQQEALKNESYHGRTIMGIIIYISI